MQITKDGNSKKKQVKIMMRKILRDIKWSTLLLEIFSVILAILLALWVNEYQQEKEDEENAIIHLKRITDEVSRNLNTLSPHNNANNKRLISLRKMISSFEGKLLSDDERIITVGYSFDPLENTEWEVVKLTGIIAHMEPDVISTLSQIYLAQELYIEHWTEFTKQFASGNVDFMDRRETDRYLGSIQFSSMTSKRLIQYYKHFLKQKEEIEGDK